MFDIQWVELPRILTIRARGVLTLEDVERAAGIMVEWCAEAGSSSPYLIIDLTQGSVGFTLHDARDMVQRLSVMPFRHVYLHGARNTDLCFVASGCLRMLNIPHTLVPTFDDARAAIEADSGHAPHRWIRHTLDLVG